jgi:hypothetical protein
VSRRAKIIAGVVVLLVVVVIVVVVVASQRRPNAGGTLRVRVSGTGDRTADAVFTPDSAGRYPNEPGWVDEGATVEA